MKPRSFNVRLVASAVVLIFTLTSFQISPQAFSATGLAAAEVSSLSAGTFAIPAELGQVTALALGAAEAPALIHIQSAHGSYQAEKNIERILGYIEKNFTVNLLLLEGASAKLQPEQFRFFPKHSAFNRKVTDMLMQEGYLTGAEAFLIESDHLQTAAWGIEDIDAYKKDRNAFISVVRADKAAQALLLKRRAEIEKRFASKLNRDLLNLVRQETAFDSRRIPFESWIKTLVEGSKRYLKKDLSDAFYQDSYPFLVRYSRLEAISSKIDRKKAHLEADLFLNELEHLNVSEEIISSFKTILQLPEGDLLKRVSRTAEGYSTLRKAFDLAFEKLPKDFSLERWKNLALYAQYIILMQEMNGKGLHEEVASLKNEIQTVLTQTEDEKEYLAQTRKFYLLSRLFDLELTRLEYEELTHIVKASDTREIPEFYQKAMDFYALAIDRENKMFANTLQRMSDQKVNRAVLVTGGFHAEGLRNLAESKGYSYVQVTPRIEEISKRDREIYLRSILGNRSIETSHMSALLGLVDPAERVAVTGSSAANRWVRSLRGLVLGMINSQEVSVRPGLLDSLTQSFLAPARLRSEFKAGSVLRGTQGNELQLARSEVRSESLVELVQIMARQDDLPEEADLIMVFGGGDVLGKVPEAVASLYQSYPEGKRPKILLAGGGPGTIPESKAYEAELLAKNIPADAILTEVESQSMKENAVNALEVLQQAVREGRLPQLPQNIIFMHAPFHVLRGADATVKVFNESIKAIRAAYIPEQAELTNAKVIAAMEKQAAKVAQTASIQEAPIVAVRLAAYQQSLPMEKLVQGVLTDEDIDGLPLAAKAELLRALSQREEGSNLASHNLEHKMLLIGGAPGAGKDLAAFVFSGAGISVYGETLKLSDLFGSAILYHSRAPRKGEVNGIKYHFRSPEEILELARRGHVIPAYVNKQLQGIAVKRFDEEVTLVSRTDSFSLAPEDVILSRTTTQGKPATQTEPAVSGKTILMVQRVDQPEPIALTSTLDPKEDGADQLIAGDIVLSRVTHEGVTTTVVRRSIKGLDDAFSANKLTYMEGGYHWFRQLVEKTDDIFTVFISSFSKDQLEMRAANQEQLIKAYPQDIFKRAVAWNLMNLMRIDQETEEVDLTASGVLTTLMGAVEQWEKAYDKPDADDALKAKAVKALGRKPLNKEDKPLDSLEAIRENAELIEGPQFIEELNRLLGEKYFNHTFRITDPVATKARAIAYYVQKRLTEAGRSDSSAGLEIPTEAAEQSGVFSAPQDMFNRMLEGVAQTLLQEEYFKGDREAKGIQIVNEFAYEVLGINRGESIAAPTSAAQQDAAKAFKLFLKPLLLAEMDALEEYLKRIDQMKAEDRIQAVRDQPLPQALSNVNPQSFQSVVVPAVGNLTFPQLLGLMADQRTDNIINSILKKHAEKIADTYFGYVLKAINADSAPSKRSEVRQIIYDAPVTATAVSNLAAEIDTAIRVAANTVSPQRSGSPSYALEIAPVLFADTRHYQIAPTVPEAFPIEWPVFSKIIGQFTKASSERMVIDQRQGIPDAESVLPLVTFARYNPKVPVILALIADNYEVIAFEKALSRLSAGGILPANFKVQGFETAAEFVLEFTEFYNSAVPFGKSIALITDRKDSVVTQIGSRRKLLSVIGDKNPLKQTASSLLAADKLLGSLEGIDPFVAIAELDKEGRLGDLMADITNYIAAQAKVLSAA